MKPYLTATLLIAALVAAAWIFWPQLSPYIQRASQTELVKVKESNPFR